MNIKRQTDYQKILLHFAFFTAFFLLRFTLSQEEPLSLALLFSLCKIEFSPLISALSFFISGTIFAGGKQILITALQTLALSSGFLLSRFLKKRKLKGAFLPPYIALTLALAIFVAFSDFTPYLTPFHALNDGITQKVCIACGVFLFSSVFLSRFGRYLKSY